jgi:hypothetical protein
MAVGRTLLTQPRTAFVRSAKEKQTKLSRKVTIRVGEWPRYLCGAHYGGDNNMNKSLYGFLVISFFISAKAWGQDQAIEPLYHQGECWTFRAVSKDFQGYISDALENGNHEICFEDGKFFKVGKGEKYIVKGVWVGLLHMKGEDERQLLDRFPLFVGQKWIVDYRGVIRGTNKPVKRTAETQVVSLENVVTAHGTFRTFRIERSIWLGGKLAGKYTYFWSPQTKSVIRYNYEALLGSSATRDIGLIKYNVNPK